MVDAVDAEMILRTADGWQADTQSEIVTRKADLPIGVLIFAKDTAAFVLWNGVSVLPITVGLPILK